MSFYFKYKIIVLLFDNFYFVSIINYIINSWYKRFVKGLIVFREVGIYKLRSIVLIYRF